MRAKPQPTVAVPRRRASTAEVAAFVIAIGQVALGYTLALLCVKDGASYQPAPNSTDIGAGLVVLGIFFAVAGFVVLVTMLLTLRGSMGGRFVLVGTELVLGVVSAVMLPTVGVLISVSASVVILLTTVLRRLGRPKAARVPA